MPGRRAPLLAVVLVVLAGCAAKAPPEEAAPPADADSAPHAGGDAVSSGLEVAVLTTVWTGGVGKELHGYAFVPRDDPDALVVLVRGLKEGARAAHVHAEPGCRPATVDGKDVAAGQSGARWGADLPDLEVSAAGNAAFAVPFGGSLEGRSFVVHALAERAEGPEEDAGPAVLCGVFSPQAWNATAETLQAFGADLSPGRVEIVPLFGATYVRVALRGLEPGPYLLSAGDREGCNGATATAREPWTETPRLHAAADGTLRAAWVVDAPAEGLRGTTVLLQRDGEGRPRACGVLG